MTEMRVQNCNNVKNDACGVPALQKDQRYPPHFRPYRRRIRWALLCRQHYRLVSLFVDVLSSYNHRRLFLRPIPSVLLFDCRLLLEFSMSSDAGSRVSAMSKQAE